MVTYFNRKDLIRFGNYLLSDERTEMIKSNPDLKSEERLKEVSHADIENFINS